MLIEILVYVVQLIIDETDVAFVLRHGFLYQGLNINIAFHSMKFKACNLVFNGFSHLHHQRSNRPLPVPSPQDLDSQEVRAL